MNNQIKRKLGSQFSPDQNNKLQKQIIDIEQNPEEIENMNDDESLQNKYATFKLPNRANK